MYITELVKKYNQRQTEGYVKIISQILLRAFPPTILHDLHLMVFNETNAPTTKLLCPNCRKNSLEQTLVNIHLGILSHISLNQLETSGEISAEDSIIKSLHNWFAADAENMWEKFARQRAHRQGALELRDPDKFL